MLRKKKMGLIAFLILSLTAIGGLRSFVPKPLWAQSSPSTPVFGHVTMIAGQYPPTPTPTRIPDNKPPFTTVVISGTKNAAGWYRTPVTLTFVVTDNLVGPGSTWYSFDQGLTWSNFEQAPTLQEKGYYYPLMAVKQENRHQLMYYSEDKLHNAEVFRYAAFNIDQTPPTVSHTLAGLQLPNGWYTRSVTITFKGQDNLSGVDYYEVNLNDEGWFAKTSPYRISSTGYYTMAYRAVDRAGNSSAVGIAKFGLEGHNEVYLPLLVKR